MGVLADWQIKRDVSITPFEDAIKRDGKISFGCGSYGYDMRVGYIFDVFSPINATEIDPKNFNKNALVRVDLTPKYEHQWGLDYPKSGVHNVGEKCKICGAWKDTPSEHKLQCPISQPDHILIPPHSFALAESIEVFGIPRDTLCVVIGKSTYARCGLIVNCTPLEPEWRGKVTIELSNTTHLPLRVYCGEGIAQCIFLRTDGYNEIDRNDIHNILKNTTGFDPEYAKAVYRDSGTCRVSYADKKGKYQDQTGLTLPCADKTS